MAGGSDRALVGSDGESDRSPELPTVSGACYIGPGHTDRWAVVQSAARQVLALVVLVRVQAAQRNFESLIRDFARTARIDATSDATSFALWPATP